MTYAQPQFDVFLCHNSEDKEAVIKIAQQLKNDYKIEPWLDDWELRPGFPWQPELEKQIAHIKSAAVFVGKSGIGPWQEDEIYGFLRQFKQRKCPVIPVLLADAPQKPQLPLSLEGITWVDFREQTRVYTAPIIKLVWGITGQKPETTVKVIPESQSDDLSYEPKKEVPNTQELRNLEVIETQNTPQNQRDDSDDDLSSEQVINYTVLQEFLAVGNWLEADRETRAIVLKLSGREQQGQLEAEDLRKLPCQDLSQIDQLWVKYSDARFGLSVQQRIWRSIGGTRGAGYEVFQRFGDCVGWFVRGNWSTYDNLIFALTASDGHLPYCRAWLYSKRSNAVVSRFSSLMSRLEQCKIQSDTALTEQIIKPELPNGQAIQQNITLNEDRNTSRPANLTLLVLIAIGTAILLGTSLGIYFFNGGKYPSPQPSISPSPQAKVSGIFTWMNQSFTWIPGSSPSSGYSITPPGVLSITAGGDTEIYTENKESVKTAPVVTYPLNGDFEVRVKVKFNPTINNQRAGLGIRSTNAPNDHLRIYKLEGKQIEMCRNLSAHPEPLGKTPYEDETIYFKIKRQGKDFSMFYSSNGSNWVLLKNDNLEISPEVEIFLFVLSANNRDPVTAQFSDFVITRL
ncbi:GUN4 domain-containing protein [Scytonema sp. PCC 10023]|uniref:GUN4 domain-containing protein n=1 Tax=Scytonema sp. PCC 10023 TaxID=1680591 RepID=UPI0039C62AEA